MRYTNKHGLPGELVTAAYDDEYTNGGADISVTSLIDAPRRFIMKAEYGDVVEKDVAEEIWPILGTAFHKIMEENTGPEVVTEERLFAEVMGWTLSGQIDRQVEEGNDTIIQDFKVTSVYTVMAWRSEWTEQLNCYRWLFWKKHGFWPKAEIIALMRDWRRTEAQRNANYPDTPIVKRPVKLMAPAEIDKLIEARMTLHQDARRQYEELGHIVDCSAEERWREPDKYAVMKKGAKRATRVLDSKADAQRLANMHGLVVETRPGGERRCEGYCEFAPVCTQYRGILKDKAVKDLKGWINDKKKR